MNHRLYKYLSLFVAAFLISNLQAQKFDKKYNEKFKVNKDVELKINANNAEIDVTTWNKNEVSVEAVITVEGLSKKEAEKYFSKWEFEALGNKSKVEINANTNKFMHLNDLSFDFNFDNFKMPEFNFDDIKIDIPNIEISDFEFPDINLDDIWKDIDVDFKEGDEFTFQFDDDSKKIVIKTKEEWEKFRKSDDYKKLKKKLKGKKIEIRKELEKAKVKLKKIDKKKIEQEIEKAKKAYKSVNKEQIEISLAKAKKAIEKMNLNFGNINSDGNSIIIIEDGGTNKEVKITRTIKIKVPKGAKFNLNTRHSKVKLPKGKTSGKVSYGSFNATDLDGGDLKISYSPVQINSVNSSKIYLNNVTDAKIASVTSSQLKSNSSNLSIENIDNDVVLTSKFGDLQINSFSPHVVNFSVSLDYGNSLINLSNLTQKLIYEIGEKSPLYPKKAALKYNLDKLKKKDINGNFVIKTKDQKIVIKGNYSQITIVE